MTKTEATVFLRRVRSRRLLYGIERSLMTGVIELVERLVEPPAATSPDPEQAAATPAVTLPDPPELAAPATAELVGSMT